MKSKKYISCIIIDDELSSQKVLQYFIKNTEVLELKKTCNTTSEAFKHLQIHRDVDLLFLDINVPQQNGLDFYKSLKDAPQVIFTTAYSQYAVEGFEVNATDYLLKPFSYERFLIAINKVLNKFNNVNITSEFIILKENKAIHKILFKDIQYVEAFGDYVKVHAVDKTIVTHSTFSNLIGKLPDYFLRIHKSYSINLNRMHHLIRNKIAVDSHTIPIGPTYKQSVLKALNL
ncbi:response regulator transcription factor [uncultured Winogradskyella sp.]|uniref:LytR/AlgR family response regulator transcription factor n=1 Tax=uncultured Winogradskyella sp. TaxID=395353 RepID=UPI0026149F84|nr:response regulator transcription factor [uncultured Winogradskyella sp.]